MSTVMQEDCTACYSLAENDGVLYPVLCKKHFVEKAKLLGNRDYRYRRWFDNEQDANDRAKILYARYPAEGYGTSVHIHKISRWWLVTGWWADSAGG